MFGVAGERTARTTAGGWAVTAAGVEITGIPARNDGGEETGGRRCKVGAKKGPRGSHFLPIEGGVAQAASLMTGGVAGATGAGASSSRARRAAKRSSDGASGSGIRFSRRGSMKRV